MTASRTVLDTNVWLDWLVFDDPRVEPVDRARAAGAIELVVDSACRAEFERVLGYPQFDLDAGQRRAVLARFDSLATRVADPVGSPLPSCRDPDDRKFLALAHSAGAAWLLTRDDALLAVSRSWCRDCGLEIMTPAQWGRTTATQPV